MRRLRDEQGSVTLEAVLLLPVVILTIVAIVQVALFAHASRLTDAAAREGARTVRLTGETAAGKERAAAFLDRHGRQVVLRPEIGVKAEGAVASVEVTGHAVSLIPGLRLGVRGSSSGVIEGFSPVASGP